MSEFRTLTQGWSGYPVDVHLRAQGRGGGGHGGGGHGGGGGFHGGGHHIGRPLSFSGGSWGVYPYGYGVACAYPYGYPFGFPYGYPFC